VLRVLGKGSKERLVPFGQVARESINTYLAEGRPAILGGQQTEDLFVTARGSAMNCATVGCCAALQTRG
jgi:integrase/recombinase XerD